MKAAVFKEARKMMVEEVPDPVAGAGEVVVKVKNVGICGSDLHLYLYGYVPSGSIMGHEATGVIASVGDDVTDWKEGDRVLVAGGPCGECDRCKKNNNRFCLNPTAIGMGVLPGAYAEYLRLPQHALLRIPADLGMREAALMDPIGCGHHGAIRGRMRAGESALVIGAGPIGLFLIHCLKHLGTEQVILSEPVARRAELGSELGADIVLDPTKVDLEEEVKKLTDGLGPEAVFECVGIPSTTLDSASLVQRDGRVVWVGVCMEEVSFLPLFWMLKNISIELVMGWGGHEKIHDYLEFICDKKDEVGKVITDVVSLDELPGAFEKLLQPNTEAKVMLEFD